MPKRRNFATPSQLYSRIRVGRLRYEYMGRQTDEKELWNLHDEHRQQDDHQVAVEVSLLGQLLLQAELGFSNATDRERSSAEVIATSYRKNITTLTCRFGG